MADRRARYPYTDYPIGDGVRDPRPVDVPYSPQRSVDIGDATALGRRFPYIADLYDRITARTQPAQVNYVMRTVVLANAGVPVELVPKNPRRTSLIIANFLPPPVYDAAGAIVKNGGTGLVYSYDQMQNLVGALATAPLWTGGFMGIPIAPQSYAIENNGAVSINDIWVCCNDTAAILPFPVVCFEGQLSIGGNKR